AHPTGSSLQEMLEAWQGYQEACIQKMIEDPQPTGLVCNRTFDMYACWDDALPNTARWVRVPEMWRRWAVGETFVDPGTIPPDVHRGILPLARIAPSAILLRDSLLWLHFPRDLEVDLSGLPRDQAVTGCRLAQILTQYCVCANYFWLLVEGLYLHNLLGPMAFMGESYLPAYLLLGWGTPLFFVIPWGIMRYLDENNECWERNDNLGYWWIIRCPILVSILVNFMIFIRVLKIVNSKLRAQQIHYTDYKCRLARSTLTLIPLLGTHGVAFALVTEEQALGTLRYGLLVSTLYCFVNKEVQSEIQRKWRTCQLDIGLLEKPGCHFGPCPSCCNRKSPTRKPSCAQIYIQVGPKVAPRDLDNGAGAPFQQEPANYNSHWYIPVR
ncbi:hypothetical protein E2320_000797, partial [Naja naja]